MAIKLVVEGISLKDYLMKSLARNSVRDLAKSEEFVKKTGIKTPSSINYYMRKLNIEQENIYRYGIDNLLISDHVQFDEWNRSSTKNTKKYKGEKDLIIEIFKRVVGVEPTIDDEVVIKQTILDFCSTDEYEEIRASVKKDWGW